MSSARTAACAARACLAAWAKLKVCGPITTGQPQAAASIRFWPPSGAKLPPSSATSAQAKYSGISPIESPSQTSAAAASGGGSSVHWLRRSITRPCMRTSASTSSNRCGCRGTSSSSGRGGGWDRHADSNGPSSPSRVLAASTTGRLRRWRHCRPSAVSRGAGVMSNFRLPQTITWGAPAARSRSASSTVCASTSDKRAAAGCSSAARRRPLAALRALRRALAITIGTPARWASCIRLGQSSVSISTPTAGRK